MWLNLWRCLVVLGHSFLFALFLKLMDDYVPFQGTMVLVRMACFLVFVATVNYSIRKLFFLKQDALVTESTPEAPQR
jgi:hypothetical protein